MTGSAVGMGGRLHGSRTDAVAARAGEGRAEHGDRDPGDDGMSSGLRLAVEGSPPVAVLGLRGDLDLSVRHRLRALVDRALAADADGVVVELSGLRFTDMTGVNALISLAVKLEPRGIRVVLVGSPRLLDRLLRALDLYEVFDHAPTLAAATGPGTRPLACSAPRAETGRAR